MNDVDQNDELQSRQGLTQKSAATVGSAGLLLVGSIGVLIYAVVADVRPELLLLLLAAIGLAGYRLHLYLKRMNGVASWEELEAIDEMDESDRRERLRLD